MTPDSSTIAIQGSVAVTARGLDANGRFISGGAFTFASSPAGIVNVDATKGVVTGLANGTAFVTATSGTITSVTPAVITVGGAVPAKISFGRDTLSVGRGSSTSIPIFLSRPNVSPDTVNLTVGDTTAFWSTASVIIPAGQTSVNATLNGHNAGTTTVTASGSGGYGSVTAVLAVQAPCGSRLGDTRSTPLTK